MSGEFIYEDYRSPQELPVKKASTGKVEKNLKRILVIAVIVLAAQFVWFFCVSPCIPFSTVELKGFPGFDGKDILSYAGIGENASFATVNAANAERILGAHYLVESASVVKRFPDRISIFLQPRKAVAQSLATIGDRQVPVYFDKNGVVFQIGTEVQGLSNSRTDNLPVLSGIVIAEPSLGMHLPSVLIPLLDELETILSGTPALMAAVSEIQVNRKPFDSYDLVLYPQYHPVRVRLGSSINEETLRYVMLVLDVFEKRGSWPVEIDFRSGMSSYTIKEVPSVE